MDIGYILRSTRHRMNEHVRERPALSLAGDQTLTWRELDELTNRYANALTSLGVGPGDKVALLLHNSLDYVALYFAITSLRAVAVRINFRLNRDEIAFVLDDSDAKILLADGHFAETIDEFRAASRLEGVLFLTGAEPDWAIARSVLGAGSPEPADVPNPGATDPAMLMYTSGTTGSFKGVLWSHDQTMWHTALQALNYRFDASTVSMTTGPVYHIGALENMLSPCLFVHGHGVISPSRGFKTVAALRAIEKFGVTDIMMFSFMLNEMLKDPTTSSIDLTSLRRMLVGGTGIPPNVTEQLEPLVPGVDLVLGYGMTETGTIVVMPEGITPGTSVDTIGRLVPGYEVMVETASGKQAAFGEEGEILIGGPSIARSYWRRPNESAATFEGGWCRSGDLGRVDVDGVLHLTGRAKEIVRTGGENVHPSEVEGALIEHPGVLDVAVIGVPDDQLEEAICALVIRNPGTQVSGTELVEFVRGRIATFKKPRYVMFVDQLDRNASGKLLRHVLRAKYTPTPEQKLF